MKTNNIRGDFTDVSAEKKALVHSLVSQPSAGLLPVHIFSNKYKVVLGYLHAKSDFVYHKNNEFLV